MYTQKIAVHESQESEKVIKFIDLDSLPAKIYNENGDIVAQDIWNTIIAVK